MSESIKSETEESRPKRIGLKLGLALVALCVAIAFIFGGEKNPEVDYKPTDGTAIVLDLQSRLMKEQGINTDPLPIETGVSNIPEPTYVATIVHYQRPQFPAAFRWLLSLVGLDKAPYHASFDITRGGFTIVSMRDSKSGMITMRQVTRTSNISTAKNFPDKKYTDEVIAESKSLVNLEPNSHLRLHSDFFLLQYKDQSRVYALDEIPAKVKSIFDRVSNEGDRITAVPATIDRKFSKSP